MACIVDNPDMALASVWDIFCRVIDNLGDLGVCWRLSRQLARRGVQVRLWLDDDAALRWMAPQGCPGVEVRPWTQPLDLDRITPGQVLIEAFGCEIPADFVEAFAVQSQRHPSAWINLEYLSAQPYVERSHRLPSPVLSGPGQGLTKHFFYPGFTPRTGGLLREPDLVQRQNGFHAASWLAQHGITTRPDECLASLFCYEPHALPDLLVRLARHPSHLLVTAGRATEAVRACQVPAGLRLSYLPYLEQDDFDHLLWSCDINFVRGEDSLVRGLWAGKPLVWQLYPQQDLAHHAKLAAFLDWLDAPPGLREMHKCWNQVGAARMPALDLAAWRDTVHQARQRLLEQSDLLTQLLEFVAHVTR